MTSSFYWKIKKAVIFSLLMRAHVTYFTGKKASLVCKKCRDIRLVCRGIARSYIVMVSAINILFLTASGPSLQCHYCLASLGGACNSQQQTQVCKNDRGSLGTRQCFSAVTRYRGEDQGYTRDGAIRGCIDCSGNYYIHLKHSPIPLP